MVVITEVKAKAIKDSRGDKTILVKIKTSSGEEFSASAPNGKSTGKYEAKPYRKTLEGDIKALEDFSDYFSEEILEKFEDLRRIEDVVDRHVGSNTLFALESAVLKAIAHEQKKEVWQLINPNAKKLPRPVGNCVGGGKHSKEIKGKRPDFQEFLLIPNEKNFRENYDKNIDNKNLARGILKKNDSNFSDKKNDENAWMVSLNEKEVLDVLKELNTPLGLDVAASSFCKRKKYLYKNPLLKRDSDEQLMYLINLIKNYNIFYIEDPFEENDYESFSKLLKKFPNTLIVGDDLTVTNHKRLQEAINKKSINAIIVKPNQNGSLLEVRGVCNLAKENGIKIIFSHRSGETEENIIADLAFGFGADFFKCGIDGKEREAKLKRLIEIEKSLR
jgi:enolase